MTVTEAEEEGTQEALKEEGIDAMQWPGLFFIAWGIFAIGTTLSSPDGHLMNFRSRLIVAIIGRKGSRGFFCVLGVGLVIFGSLVLFGLIKPKG